MNLQDSIETLKQMSIQHVNGKSGITDKEFMAIQTILLQVETRLAR